VHPFDEIGLTRILHEVVQGKDDEGMDFDGLASVVGPHPDQPPGPEEQDETQAGQDDAIAATTA
jgi:hypothetical protein